MLYSKRFINPWVYYAMEELEEKLRNKHGNLTYEEIMDLLEEELYDSMDSPYKPLNFHDEDEDF